jgi:hypothetical protein
VECLVQLIKYSNYLPHLELAPLGIQREFIKSEMEVAALSISPHTFLANMRL